MPKKQSLKIKKVARISYVIRKYISRVSRKKQLGDSCPDKMASNSSQTKLTSFLKKNIEFNDVAFDHDLLKIKKEPLIDYQTEKDNMLGIKKEKVDYFANEIKTEIQSFSVSDLQCDQNDNHSNEFSSENSRDEKSKMILEEHSSFRKELRVTSDCGRGACGILEYQNANAHRQSDGNKNHFTE